MDTIFLTVICSAIRHLENVNIIQQRKINQKVSQISKQNQIQVGFEKNQHDILLLCIPVRGMNEIIIFKNNMYNSEGGGLP